MSIEFEYAQARAQARHGDRLAQDNWGLLESSVGLPQFLHLVRGTALAARVQHFSANTSPHAIERSLRREWRAEVDNTAHWVPARWRPAIAWTRWLPELPTIGYLLDGGPALPWMSEDPVLSGFALEDPGERRLAFEASELGEMPGATKGGKLLDAWQRHWMDLWPEGDAGHATLHELVTLVRGQVEAGDRRVKDDEHRSRLEGRVVRMMRKSRGEAAVAFCHLLLTALELHRLRDGLLRRALFNDVIAEGHA